MKTLITWLREDAPGAEYEEYWAEFAGYDCRIWGTKKEWFWAIEGHHPKHGQTKSLISATQSVVKVLRRQTHTVLRELHLLHGTYEWKMMTKSPKQKRA